MGTMIKVVIDGACKDCVFRDLDMYDAGGGNVNVRCKHEAVCRITATESRIKAMYNEKSKDE